MALTNMAGHGVDNREQVPYTGGEVEDGGGGVHAVAGHGGREHGVGEGPAGPAPAAGEQKRQRPGGTPHQTRGTRASRPLPWPSARPSSAPLAAACMHTPAGHQGRKLDDIMTNQL